MGSVETLKRLYEQAKGKNKCYSKQRKKITFGHGQRKLKRVAKQRGNKDTRKAGQAVSKNYR